MIAFSRLLLRFRLPLIGLLLLLATLAALELPRLRIDLSLSSILEGRAEERDEVMARSAAFPSVLWDYLAILTYEAPIDRERLEDVARFADALRGLPEVQGVLSLADVPVVVSSSALFPVVKPFRSLDLEDGVIAAVARRPLLRSRFLSNDGRSAALYIASTASSGAERERLFAPLEAAARRLLGPSAELRFTGGESIQRTIKTLMRRDVLVSLALELAVFAVLLPFVFRSLRGAVLPIVSVLLALLFVGGTMAALDRPVTILEVAVPALVLIIGLSDAIHLVHGFENAMKETGDRDRAVVTVMRRVGAACFHTSFTTGIGFLSLCFTGHVAVRELGKDAALAVLLAFLTVIVVMPLGLSVWPVRAAIDDRLAGRTRIVLPSPRLAAIVTFLVLGVSVGGGLFVRVDSHVLEEIPAGHPVERDLRFFQDRFEGMFRFVVEIDGDLDDPAVFRALEHLQSEILKERAVTSCNSYLDVVRASLGDPEEALTDEQIRRGLKFTQLVPFEMIRPFLDLKHRSGRMVFQTVDISTTDYLRIAARFEELGRQLPAGVSARAGGYNLLAHRSAREVVTTMLTSLALSFVVIAVFLSLVFRSLRIGLVAMIPNVIPVVIVFGVSGFLGINLRIGVVMIYALGLGLAVDDTIHLITCWYHERERDAAATPRLAVERALERCGRALILTSIVLAVGGLCFLPCSLRSLREVGILLTTVVASALVADLYLTPLLLQWVGARSRRAGPEGPTRPS